ncbi:MAG: hypothetical protein KIY12_05450 [Thermoplasmata archaeon]|uniref:Uncharacterized protein n=1 Tax=Candidatus Sysuiplasma superficiale TaxID=2823368 RepID=A0A8J8CHQ0_9ARCH|nr:hypothetical protein [Candidatus Sysuiplasma superficiale]MBX8644153.1 hypothetical protein [Candidatus Sysuiplasma superficiale]MCL4346690.1 hypothetical protein [Candidatus Thermoplasmatota archaeon]
MNPVAERCPRCGKSTKVEKGEILAYCSSCKSLHEIGEKSVVDVEIAKFSSVKEGRRVYIPFWRFFSTFDLPSSDETVHKNLREFIKEGNGGRMFVYVPAAELGQGEALTIGARMTAYNPVYSTTFSFNDVEHLKCCRTSSDARSEVEYYFLAAETSEGRREDLLNGFRVEPSHEKMVFLPFYRSDSELIPAV